MPRFQTTIPSLTAYLYHWQRFVPDYLIPLLRDSVVWCSDPTTFNDPWDCKPYFSTELVDRDEIEHHVQSYAEVTRRHRPDIPEKFIAQRQREFRENPKLIADCIEQLSKEMWSAISQRYRVYCLGPNVGSLLMWSHYADNHRGICLEFSTRNEVICCAQRVEYCREFPRMSAFSEDEDQNLVPLLTKAEVWSYEQEYRLIAQANNDRTNHETLVAYDNYMKLPDSALTSIIVGCQGPFEEVRRLVNNLSPHIPVRRALRVPNKYALTIDGRA